MTNGEAVEEGSRLPTVEELERRVEVLELRVASLDKIVQAFEDAGAELFIRLAQEKEARG